MQTCHICMLAFCILIWIKETSFIYFVLAGGTKVWKIYDFNTTKVTKKQHSWKKVDLI